jgi:hypothetical protein
LDAAIASAITLNLSDSDCALASASSWETLPAWVSSSRSQIVELDDPIAHCHGLAAARLKFGEVEVGGEQ